MTLLCDTRNGKISSFFRKELTKFRKKIQKIHTFQLISQKIHKFQLNFLKKFTNSALGKFKTQILQKFTQKRLKNLSFLL